MILAARYDATGNYAGQIIRCREITGPQRWLVKFELVTPEGVREEREVTCDQPIPLQALGPFASECISDLFTGKDVIAKSASWRAYIVSDKGQRQRPKRRKRR